MRKSRKRKIQKKQTNFDLVKKPLLKVVAILLLFGLNWTGLSAIGQTIAYYNDLETSDGNFTASTLDFSLDFTRSDGFRTQTQGGWGASAHGDNPAVYRDANFDLAFPTGLTIGGGFGYSAHFATSADIENFLPSGGPPAPFSQNHENPTDTEAGVLAGQVVALTLNLGFDVYDPNFSVNTSTLENYYANEPASPCEDMTAGEVLTEANNILAGQLSVFSPSVINGCIDEINNKFDDGLTRKITPDESVGRWIDIINIGLLNFQYQMNIEQTSGDTDFCQALDVDAYLNGTLVYSGNLLDFTYTPSIFSILTNEWQLDIGLPADAPSSLQNKTCEFKYTVFGWQTDFTNESQGFTDEETIADTVSSGDWSYVAINKVYYDVDSSHGDEADNEWIELYNPASGSVDLSNWKICDNNACDILPDSTLIPAGGFAIITNQDTTWNYWEIPTGVTRIVLSSPIGNSLNNTADMLILKNPAGKIIDQMNWGAPDSDWPNYNLNVWDPGCTDVTEGHMLGRVPLGLDTDQPSDFIDLGLPQVTVLSPNGGEIWWVGRTHNISWTATNPNGPDSALTIDLWYSKDSGATWGNVVRGINNSGTYDFRVPLCFDDGNGGCYYAPSHTARVKVVAHGPENFMVQAWDQSDQDFCPPIDYGLLLPEEIEMLRFLGLLPEGMELFPIEEPSIFETPIITQDEATTTPENTDPPADTGNTEPAIEIPADSGNTGDNSGQEAAETVAEPPTDTPLETTVPEEETTITDPADHTGLVTEPELPADNPADNFSNETGDSNDQPADTTENIPDTPAELSEQNPALEPEPAITVEPPAPVESAPGPDPAPPAPTDAAPAA
ncbi:MAG: lamin tail domain-containing protein [Patescibacteria group bacterium]|jgi:hypothetical protein